MPDPRWEQLIAIHEIIKLAQVVQTDIPQEAIDKFDFAFENKRETGQVAPDAESDEDPAAPYHEAHKLASEVERKLADAPGVDWEECCAYCAEL